MHHPFLPGRHQLEHHATANRKRTVVTTQVASRGRGAIEVALRVRQQTPVRTCSICPAREGIEWSLFPTPVQLEHQSATTPGTLCHVAAAYRRSIEIALPIPRQKSIWGCSVRETRKSVQHCFRPAVVLRGQFVDHSATCAAERAG